MSAIGTKRTSVWVASMFALEVMRTSLEPVGLSATVGASSADRPGVKIGSDFGG